MKKKILALSLCVALLAVAVVGGTLAYFSDSDDARNTFTVGNVDIKLTEPNWEGNGKEDAPEVYPGEALAKDPTVTNEGANPCFVRLEVTGLDSLVPADATEEEAAALMIQIRNAAYTLGAVNEGWTLGEDGYLYYNSVLAAGETTTTPAFSSVVMPVALENGDGETEYNIDVKAYAVQAQGAKPSFSAVQQMTVEEIADWFDTCAPEWTKSGEMNEINPIPAENENQPAEDEQPAEGEQPEAPQQ